MPSISATRLVQRLTPRVSTYRWPLVITATLVMTAVFSLSPLVDVAHPNAGLSPSLRTPIAYDLVAPASNVLDALTLLSPAQYWATFGLCATIFIALWSYRRIRSRVTFAIAPLVRAALGFVGGAIAIVGIMLVPSRPMASLALGDRDLIAIDFHSHTDASHDGRAGFDAEQNREWHSSSGFDAVYVTDHRTFDGALAGLARNPARAGARTVLLPGVELRDGDEHPILIGVDPKRMRITSPDWKGAAVAADGGTTGAVRVAAIEVSDGSPRGMAQSARDQEAILALAGKLHLAIVSATDNHGWGRTSPAWSVMRIPGWRAMTPAELDIAIRRTIITRGPRAIAVIARRIPSAPRGKLDVALSGVAVALVMTRTMSLTDRVSWIVWSWALYIFSVLSARRRIYLRIRARQRAGRKAPPMIDAAA
ncbi:MAG: hypothetical protein AUI63_01805 [Gemmatimonadetes bacterium 13_1_40CM_2_60_3]|nr:MAG: hypothetical protein AUI63_01805 [Gemmatimonadetes bacterium 13_1_40CM_2_60_3]